MHMCLSHTVEDEVFLYLYKRVEFFLKLSLLFSFILRMIFIVIYTIACLHKPSGGYCLRLVDSRSS